MEGLYIRQHPLKSPDVNKRTINETRYTDADGHNLEIISARLVTDRSNSYRGEYHQQIIKGQRALAGTALDVQSEEGAEDLEGDRQRVERVEKRHLGLGQVLGTGFC